MRKRSLTIQAACTEAAGFARVESSHSEPSLFGVTDGKAVGTYLEHKFLERLGSKYAFVRGSSAKGIDLPDLGIDIKATSIRQPQSSCPFKSPRDKVFGLGYALLVFVYQKTDLVDSQTASLDIRHVIFVEADRTGDYQMTRGLLEILDRNGNEDDLIAFMHDRMLPVDDIQAGEIATEVLARPPQQGYLTISNALQWRLQYRRIIETAGEAPGVVRVR